MDFDGEGDRLPIWSQGAAEIYEVNGICQCKAFEKNFLCWHRTAKRLLERYNAAMLEAFCSDAEFYEVS